MADRIFLAVNVDGFLVRRKLTRQGGDAVRRNRSCRPGFVDRLQRVALQASVAHRFFGVAFCHLGTAPAVLTAAENVPGHDELAGDVIALANKRIGVNAVRRAALKRNVWNIRAGGGMKSLLCGFPV